MHDQGVDGDFTEIERKWILKRIPEGFPLIVDAICEQSYLSISPEVRLRKRAETGNAPLFFLDVKSSGTMERNEITIPISEKEVHSYALLLEGKPVIKKKWHLFDVGNGQTLEVTIVDPGTETEFIYVEVEFRTRREAENFVLPIPDAIEVTDDQNYKMKNYWKSTRIEKANCYASADKDVCGNDVKKDGRGWKQHSLKETQCKKDLCQSRVAHPETHRTKPKPENKTE